MRAVSGKEPRDRSALSVQALSDQRISVFLLEASVRILRFDGIELSLELTQGFTQSEDVLHVNTGA